MGMNNILICYQHIMAVHEISIILEFFNNVTHGALLPNMMASKCFGSGTMEIT
jgi:hypothetical protein